MTNPFSDTIELRPWKIDDLEAITLLYSETVLKVGAQYYSPEQVKVWANLAQAGSLKQNLLSSYAVVAQSEAEIVGFANLARDGKINYIYVKGDRPRQGIGSILLTHLLSYAEREKIYLLTSEASEFSKHLFHKFGFVTTGTEEVTREGVIFLRYLVAKSLSPSP